MRVLILTQLFPTSLEPAFATFNRRQFTALSRLCDLELLATVPWFPGAKHFGRWSRAGRTAGVPAFETIDGLAVAHPRVLYIPRVGHRLSGHLYAVSVLPSLAGRRRADVILGSFAYPDGFAAVQLGRLLRVPVVVKVHGTDINVLAGLPSMRSNLHWTLERANAVVATSGALADAAVQAGARMSRTSLVTNGLDTRAFRPRDRNECRRALGVSDGRKWILYVGNLKRAKGVFDLLSAFETLGKSRSDACLKLVGDGEDRRECEAAATAAGLDAAFMGVREHDEIGFWMGACDVLCLPSWAEGTPNVVMEALASDRPVVATNVGGIPALMCSPELGDLVPPRQPARLAAALAKALDERREEGRIAGRVSFRSWDRSARSLHDVLARAAAEGWRP